MKRHTFLLLAIVTFLLMHPPHVCQASPTSSAINYYPTDEEILAKADILVSHELSDKERTAAMRESIAAAVRAWLLQEYPKAVRLFRAHLSAFSDSPWRTEALLHLGFDGLNNMRFTEAEENFTTIINENQTRDTRGAKLLLNRAKIGLGNVKVNQHNLKAARAIFSDLQKSGSDWRERTYADHWLHRLSGYSSNELSMLNCGAQALAWLMDKDGDAETAAEVRELLPESREGHSLKDLYDIAEQYGYQLDAARMTAADIGKLSLPVIMHVKNDNPDEIGHFWILEKIEDNILTFYVPKEGLQFRQSLDEFVREWSGYAITLSEEPLPGVALTQSEMAGIYGANGGGGGPRPEDNLGSCNPSSRNPSGEGPPSGKSRPKMCQSTGGNQSSAGAPIWLVNMINLNFHLTDTPLWYTPPIGPNVSISLNYNTQSAFAANETFGNKWQFNYGSYLEVQTSGAVLIYMPDGKRDFYNPDNAGGYTRPYKVFNTLTKISATNFTLAFPNGRTYVFDKPQPSLAYSVLTEIRDAYGQKLSFTYNTSGQLTTITDATGKKTTLTYNGNGLVTQVADPFGRVARFEYDLNKNLTKITDMGGYWSSFTYDTNVYLTSLSNGLDTWGFVFEPSLGVTGDDYRITVTNPVAGKDVFEYISGWFDLVPGAAFHTTPAGNKTTYTYSVIGARAEISGVSSATGDNSTGYHYNSNGIITSINDSAGHTISFSNNTMGRPIQKTDAKGAVSTLMYYANNVDLASITDGLGTITQTYNATHDITSITDRMGKTRSMAYNSYGQLTATTDPLGVVTSYNYDSTHFLAEISRGGLSLMKFTYDAPGRTKTVTDADGLTKTIDYNNLDDVVKETQPDGKFVQRSYSATIPHLLTSSTDRNGRTDRYTYTPLRRLSRVDFHDRDYVVYEYDANGNMTRLVDPMGNSTAYAYDADDRLIKETYPDGRAVTYSYTDGLLNNNEYVKYTYDANHNLTGDGRRTYTYDAYNRLTAMTSNNSINFSGPDYSIGYTHGADSRISSIDGPWDNDTISVQHDDKGRMTGLSVQGGQTVSYGYDSHDRITTIQTETGAYSYSYSGASRVPHKLSRPNGSYTDYQYDNLMRLQSLANMTSSDTVISRYDYTYDGQDQRASETASTGPATPTIFSGTTAYAYNNLNQVISRSNAINATYTYDTDGHMVSEDFAGPSNTAAYGYSDGMVYFIHSANGIKTNYDFDGNKLLLRTKTEIGTNTTETRYVRLGNTVLQERDVNNAVVREYIWGIGMGGGTGGLLDLKQGGQHYSYLYDGKGNVTSLINGNQAVVAAYAYDPFGVPASSIGALDQPYRFSTKPYDDNTKLVNYGYRFYKPDIGRWVSRDPLGMRLTEMNLYGFVHNDPMNWKDPDGLIAIHGNWCGPGWTGGKDESYTPHPAGYYAAPIDMLDAACKDHDICYYNCRKSNACNKDNRSRCFRQCDYGLTAASYKAQAYSFFGLSPMLSGASGSSDGVIVGLAIDRPESIFGNRDPEENDCSCEKSN